MYFDIPLPAHEWLLLRCIMELMDALADLSLTVVFRLLQLGIFGVLWIPIGSLIIAWVAHRKGLPVGVWVGRGALYSVPFILPWGFVIARMYHRSIPSIAIRAAYVMLYAAWLIGPVALMGLLSIDPLIEKMQGGHDTGLLSAPLLYAVWVALAVVNALQLGKLAEVVARESLRSTNQSQSGRGCRA